MVIVCRYRFRDLEIDLRRVHAVAGDDFLHAGCEARLDTLKHRKIHADPVQPQLVGNPLGDERADLLQHEIAKILDDARLLRRRNELGGRDVPKHAVVQAQQRLRAVHPKRGHFVDRLIVYLERMLLQPAMQRAFHLKAPQQVTEVASCQHLLLVLDGDRTVRHEQDVLP